MRLLFLPVAALVIAGAVQARDVASPAAAEPDRALPGEPASPSRPNT